MAIKKLNYYRYKKICLGIKAQRPSVLHTNLIFETINKELALNKATLRKYILRDIKKSRRCNGTSHAVPNGPDTPPPPPIRKRKKQIQIKKGRKISKGRK